MSGSNFTFLSADDDRLAVLAGRAERYFTEDPAAEPVSVPLDRNRVNDQQLRPANAKPEPP